MKKRKLIVELTYDFELWGIVSSLKEYKLAWIINNECHINFSREKDIQNISKKTFQEIINYKYETENTIIRLLKNKSQNEGKLSHLVPELKEVDYFFMIDSEDDTFPKENLYHCLGNCKGIEYLTKIDYSSLKSKENLIL